MGACNLPTSVHTALWIPSYVGNFKTPGSISRFLQVVAGILLSTDDESILSSASWKCSTQYVAGWESPAFNDASWPAASISGDHSASNIHHVLSPISLNAKWIWTKNFIDPAIDATAYCRLSIGELVSYLL